MDLLIAIIASLILSFLLSGLESAVLSHSPARLRHFAKEGKRQARWLDRIMRHKEQLLASILLLNATVNLVAFAMITVETVTRLGWWGYLAAFAVSLPFYLVWVELLPKSIFKRAPIRLMFLFTPVLLILHYAIRPVILFLAIPGRWLGRRLYGSDQAVPGATRAEFRALTEVLERQGTLSARETRMIQGVLDFQQVHVGDVMLPLSKVTAVPQEMPIQSVLALGRQTGFDQFPVMGPNGDIVGLVDVVELLREGVRGGTVQQHRHKLVRSGPAETAIAVIRRLRRAGHQIAAVYNDQGRPIGIVGVEDLIGRLTLGAT